MTGVTARFPANPKHGDIFELRQGLFFQYDASVNAWIKIVSSNLLLPVVTNVANGVMTADDLKKLNRLVIPPPKSTIIGNDCIAPFKSGTIALYSGDDYVHVDGKLAVQNVDEFGDTISNDFPFQIHQHTYGYDFNLDIPSLVAELKRRGQLEVTGTIGLKGDKGEKGDHGVDDIMSGPAGDTGEQGNAPECKLAIEQEVVQSEILPGLQKALVAARVVPSVKSPHDSTKYAIQFDRQTIGASASTSKFIVQQQKSYWILAVESIAGTPQAIYYLDIEPMIETVRQKFLSEVELLKKGYEDIVAFWIQTMSDLFDEQKDALCCAIECCKSRTKGTQLRQHMESVAAAALPNATINVHGRNSSEAYEIPNTSMLVKTNCYETPIPDDALCSSSPVVPPPPPSGGGLEDDLVIDDSHIDPVDCASGMDVVFVVDDTGSMRFYIDAMKSAVRDYSDYIKTLSGGDYRIGLMSFKDEDAITVRNAMSPDNQEQFIAAVNGLSAGGGGDTAEASSTALIEALNGAAGNWRPTKANIVIVITDAPPRAGIADAQTAADLAKSLNIRVSSIHTPITDSLYDELAAPALKAYVETSGGVYVRSGSGKAEQAIVNGALNVCGVAVKSFVAKLAVDPLINAGSADNGASVEIPAGDYVATIVAATSSINGKHRSNVRLQYTNNSQRKSSTFLDKGEFQSLVDGRNAYEGLTLPFSHDGGTVSLYFPIIPQRRASGEVQIEIKKASQQSVAKKSEAIAATQLRRPQRRAEKIVPISDGSFTCALDISRLRWYEKRWLTGNCCGAVINVNGQDYIIVKNSLIGDDSCGGGEIESTPCIQQFIKTHGHPSFAWPTFDGTNFAPIPNIDKISFKYDQTMNDLVAQKLADEEYNNPKGNPAGLRHLTYQLMTILFPVAP